MTSSFTWQKGLSMQTGDDGNLIGSSTRIATGRAPTSTARSTLCRATSTSCRLARARNPEPRAGIKDHRRLAGSGILTLLTGTPFNITPMAAR